MAASGIPWEEGYRGLCSLGMGRGCWGYWGLYWGDARDWDLLGRRILGTGILERYWSVGCPGMGRGSREYRGDTRNWDPLGKGILGTGLPWDGERMLGILGRVLGGCWGLGFPGKKDTGDCVPLEWGEDLGDTGGCTGPIPGTGIPWEKGYWGLGSPAMGRGCWGYWGDAGVWDVLGWGEDAGDTGGMLGSGIPWEEGY